MKKLIEKNENNKKQLLLLIIGLVVLIGAAIGLTYAFFSYVYNGEEENSIKTGTIFFTASDTYMELSNVFPTTLEKTDKVATVSVQGSTTYEDGIDFMIKATEVKSQNPNIIPTVVVTRENVEGITYTDGKEGVTTYDKNNRLTADTVLCSGNVSQGDGITDLTKILTVKVYYDMNDYHISDNTKEQLVASGLLDKNYSGEIIDTETWNALSSGNMRNKTIAYSFRIQVIAVEGGREIPDNTEPEVADPIVTINNESIVITGNSITIPYTVDQSDVTVTCEYAKDTNYGSNGTVSNNQCVINNLEYGTQYFYKITATNSANKKGSATGSTTTIEYCESELPNVTTTCNNKDFSSSCPESNFKTSCDNDVCRLTWTDNCRSSCSSSSDMASCMTSCMTRNMPTCVDNCVSTKVNECITSAKKNCITNTMKSKGCTGY